MANLGDDAVRDFAAHAIDARDDTDDAALYFDGAPWVGRVIDGTELAGEVRFALGPAVPLEASRLALALRQLEQRFTDAHFVGKLC